MKKNSFVRKKVSSLTLGEKLKSLRENEHMSIYTLSRRISVKEKYIEVLEKGIYNELPTKVYAKGFVRSYARFFGVSEKVLLDLFEREYSVFKNINIKEPEDTVNKLPKLPRIIFTPKILLTIVGLITLGFVGLYLYFSVDNFVSSPWLVINEPLNNIQVDRNFVVIKGKTKNNSKVFVNGQQIFVDMEGSFEEKVNLIDGVNEVIVKSINKFEKESIERLVINAKFEKNKIVEPEKNIKLILKAGKKQVLLDISVDGVEVYNDILEVDEEKEISAIKKINITTSSGVNTLVSIDGGDTFESISEKDEVLRGWIYEGNEEKEKNEGYVGDEKSDN